MSAKRNIARTYVSGILCFLLVVFALGGTTLLGQDRNGTLPGGAIGWYRQGAPVVLGNTANYAWWYGCSPTSAGMMMGYYDRNVYQGNTYPNLVPGGVAEATTYAGVPPFLANNAIASAGHIADFYKTPPGYGGSGDDNVPATHSFNCLADFMGTSQDNLPTGGAPVTNVNGGTTFYYWTNGAPFTAADALAYNVWQADGMYGIGEYVKYCGYDYKTLYTQHIYVSSSSFPLGFTYPQYQAEIDAGRPVLIQVEGHTMLGYGYDAANNLVDVYDTWAPNGQNPGTMTWGGAYSGMNQWGVVVMDPVPEPSTIVLLVAGACGLCIYGFRRRKRAA